MPTGSTGGALAAAFRFEDFQETSRGLPDEKKGGAIRGIAPLSE
jgi:hypothetical protein